MTSFLNDTRRSDLAAQLAMLGMSQDDIDHLILVEDDLFEVDTAMAAHVLVVAKTRDSGELEVAHMALTILQTLMEEALERGHAEEDFPMMLHAVKDDLQVSFNMKTTTLQ